MRIIVQLFAVGFFLAGLAGLAFSAYYPFSLSLSGASAIQATQVYTQSASYATISVGLLVASGVTTLFMMLDSQEQLVNYASASKNS